MTRLVTFNGSNKGEYSNLLTKEQRQEFQARQTTILTCKAEVQVSIEGVRSNCRSLAEKFKEIENSFLRCSSTFATLESISEKNARSWEAIRHDIAKITEMLRSQAKTIRKNLARGQVANSLEG